jgi:disulfide bond formation protein DsbB
MTAEAAPNTLFSNGLARPATLLAFILGLLAIGGALVSQYVFGLEPCELCLEQRLAYYLGLPVLALLLLLWRRLPPSAWHILTILATALFVWSTYMGGYHAGVEWGFWPGPTACTGTGGAISFGDLSDINAARVVPCDVVQFRFLGLSLAGYNALVSLAIVALLGFALGTRRR